MRRGQINEELAAVGEAKMALFRALRDVIPDDLAGIVVERLETLVRAMIAAEIDKRY